MSDFAASEEVVPTVRSRGRRFSTRLKTVATLCAMGSWGLLVVIPVVAIMLTDFPHLG
jgi:hypothetical protein